MGHKSLKDRKPPTLVPEFVFVTVNLFFLKLYSETAFFAMSFFTILLPLMAYCILTLFAYLLKFVQFMQIEDQPDESQLLTVKQRKLLGKIIRNLLFYFGLYFLSQQLDEHIRQNEIEKINLLPAFIGVNVAFLIQLFMNYQKRKAIQQAAIKSGDLEAGKSGILGSTGLATVFNALTQTTTTLCANGQCFTLYSNTIASNLAAFGVTVTAINTYLVPLCCLLLGYSIWCLYKEKRSLTYKPFMLGVLGAALIIFDNFLYGESLNLQNIPSWAGNAFLIIAAIWAGRDSAKDNTVPLGF